MGPFLSHTHERSGLHGHAWSGVSPGAQTYVPGVPVAADLPQECVLDSLASAKCGYTRVER